MTEHCSGLGIAATASHPAIVAQNMDLESFRDGLQTLLHIKDPSGLEAYVLTAPGLIGVNGINDQGVGVTANTLAQLAHNRDGLPVAFVVRGVLQRSTFGEIEAFLNGVHHASGQNYTVGASGRVAYFEASAHKVVEVSTNGGFLYHTNHPLANDDYSEEGSEEMRRPNLLGQHAHTVPGVEGAPGRGSRREPPRSHQGDAALTRFGREPRLPQAEGRGQYLHLWVDHHGPLRAPTLPPRDAGAARPARVHDISLRGRRAMRRAGILRLRDQPGLESRLRGRAQEDRRLPQARGPGRK